MRGVGPLVVALVLLALAVGGASGLNLAGGVAQAGVEADLRCDEDGVQVSYGLTADLSAVNSLTVAGIDADCAGAVMVVWVDRASASPLQFLAVPLSPGSRSFGISPPVPVEDLVGVRVLVIGHDQEPPNKND
jgi:hypothetical protein